MKVKIKENSFVARIARKCMNTPNIAIVFGDTIHLCNCTKQDFLRNSRWVKHELTHVAQYKRYGFVPFLFLYMKEWMKNGYYNNRFEREARESERKEDNLNEFEIE